MHIFFTSVEFYVILAVIAAAIVAFAAKPPSTGPVREILLPCVLSEGEEDGEPALLMRCHDDGRFSITRIGVEGLTSTGAVSLAITVKGWNMHIEERLTPGRGIQLPPMRARAMLPFIPLGRYHVSYNSGSTGLFTSFTFAAKPGMEVYRELNM